ncbi:MAG: bifunctional folylpolyglutamate synthase/dihydrofolate synthase [Methylibium sp.]|uniref:bifunctional folylpolyglutamate synthase/dihydrofolate synthase n=1 Tax=Methylibium sp. TaxID=2067992 RepID=UPI0017F8F03E|nr:folylpolyglutamate synthase/dihydrofolate synthase family protein [Methylibium sp.]MBA2724120.1 bifunctional folylpolyglutamate synthase/dihydrofolate synthase [Methylibium sp.]MBA3590113.1 bifunctional folylpolyglutamate synthase/dihydrofolate synthase [Methylibium sp.]MBA3623234.1 bifunctional folylpolyglutamate synthase/dihydrofolate synthase [Methylibium sp.]
MTEHLASHDARLERLHRLHPRAVDLSLDRIQRLCRRLDHPERRLPPVVHVAGTNGKGSTIAFLRAIAEAAGLRTHVYTSPHLVCFAERIRLSGSLISEEHLGDVLARVEAANNEEPVTFFEITTAAALLAFAETPADLCLLEVGMGGRLDATNVVEQPAISVITPIGLDHCEFLGDTVDKIAGEKAGIIKAGIPCVVAEQEPGAFAIIDKVARHLAATVSLAGRDFSLHREGNAVYYIDQRGATKLPSPGLAGDHQLANAALAAAAARRLGIADTALAEGMQRVTWPARMQRLTTGPLADKARARGADLWLDGGHNPHAIAVVCRFLDQLRSDGRPIAVVLGLLAQKDAKGIFEALAVLRPFRLVVTAVHAESAAAPEDLAAIARTSGIDAMTRNEISSAVDGALEGVGPAPHVLICGSLYLAGEVLAASGQAWAR